MNAETERPSAGGAGAEVSSSPAKSGDFEYNAFSDENKECSGDARADSPSSETLREPGSANSKDDSERHYDTPNGGRSGQPPKDEDHGHRAVARVMALFRGNTDAYGTYGEPELDINTGKCAIKKTARTIKKPPTADIWARHLKGEEALGIIPVGKDGTCSFGCLDVDDYTHSLGGIIGRASAAKLPLVPVQSKSGGLHLFLFVYPAAPAESVRDALAEMARRLSLRECEIFPKQSKVEVSGTGNWIAMPYFGSTFGGKIREQAGLRIHGGELTLDEFLRAAEGSRLTPEALLDFTRKDGNSSRRGKRRGRSSGSDQAGRAYAEQKLVEYMTELADTPDGQRNNKLAAAAFHLGTMVARDWIDRGHVRESLWRIFEQHWPGFDVHHTADTLDRQLNAGSLRPHADVEEEDEHPQSQILLKIAEEEAGVFHAPDGTCFADITVGTAHTAHTAQNPGVGGWHRETWSIQSREFRLWLIRRFYEITGRAPASEAMSSALRLIEAQAHFDGPERPTFVRVGESDGRIYIDLGDPSWSAIEIDVTGWRIVSSPPVRFRRSRGMRPLPMPTRGGPSTSCVPFLMSRATPISCWSLPGWSLLCVIAAPTRCLSWWASRARQSRSS
jgi:hypothetical protein